MLEDRRSTIALAAIFILALVLKLYFATQDPLIYNNDAGYYVEHIGEVLSQGYPDVQEPPIPFYYAGSFALFLGIMLGFKVAICLASAAIAFPVYKLTEHLCKKRGVALVAAFLAAFSPSNMIMMGDLLKNQVGLFFGAWFVYFLLKATDRFSMRDAALAAASAILMVGSHLSSSGYVVFTAAPFLVLLPLYNYWGERRLGKESLFCIAMAGVLLIAGLGVMLYRGMGVSGGGIGSVGFYGGQGGIAGLVDEYLPFVPFALLGLYALGRRRLLFFLPWLLITSILSLPFLTAPGWESRFIWNAYFMVAALTAIGAGHFGKDGPVFWAMAAILCIYAFAGFVYYGDYIGPIITEGEWVGLQQLHKERPDIAFSMVEGGTAQWVNAAGFRTTASSIPGNYLLLCDIGQKTGDNWLDGACLMTAYVERDMIDRTEPVASIGRFYVVPVEQVPESVHMEREPGEHKPQTDGQRDGRTDDDDAKQ